MLPQRDHLVSSKHHSLVVPRHSLIHYSQRGVQLDRDIVLLIEQAEPFKPRAQLELDETNNSVAIQLTFVPQPLTQSPTITEKESATFTGTDADMETEKMGLRNEFVFIIDRSGSMAGSPIERVSDTFSLLLRALPPHSRFNIVGFEENVNTATAATNREVLKADLGGTELLRPLELVLSAEPLKSTRDKCSCSPVSSLCVCCVCL